MNEKEDKKQKLNDAGPPALTNTANHESSEASSIVTAMTLDCLPSEFFGIII